MLVSLISKPRQRGFDGGNKDRGAFHGKQVSSTMIEIAIGMIEEFKHSGRTHMEKGYLLKRAGGALIPDV